MVKADEYVVLAGNERNIIASQRDIGGMSFSAYFECLLKPRLLKPKANGNFLLNQAK